MAISLVVILVVLLRVIDTAVPLAAGVSVAVD